jgi:ATP-dependent helicase/nuclease subunit A
MTRAADRLYICGASNKDLSDHCWYSRIRVALMRIGEPVTDSEGRTVWRYQRPRPAAGDEASLPPPAQREAPALLPSWAQDQPPTEEKSLIWLTPSRPATNRAAVAEISSPLATAVPGRFRRGLLIHRLLQSLPDMPPAEREGRAHAFLAQTGHDLPPAAREEIAGTVMRLLADSAFGGIFAKGGLAEIPLAAQVRLADGREIPVVGRIDRLVVNATEVLILDFKTNRPPPVALEQIDQVYVRQLALYRRALMQLFPDRDVRAALLWTEGPRLMELPAAMMEAVLA